jgi:hypothetical protein
MSDTSNYLPEGLTPEAKKQRKRFLKTYLSHLQKVRKISLSILIWGAGPARQSKTSEKRKEMRKRMVDLGHNAMFSEELEQQDSFSQKTVEFAQALAADLVIILLEDSPGALGEVHDFAIHPDLIHKIYVLAPTRYREGYCGVGVCALLEKSHGGIHRYTDDELNACCVTSKAVERAEARRELAFLSWKKP